MGARPFLSAWARWPAHPPAPAQPPSALQRPQGSPPGAQHTVRVTQAALGSDQIIFTTPDGCVSCVSAAASSGVTTWCIAHSEDDSGSCRRKSDKHYKTGRVHCAHFRSCFSYFDSVVRVDICAQASVKVLRQLQPQSGGDLFTARRLHCAQSDYISLDFTSMPSSLEHILVDIDSRMF